jgi:hypothetical protein
MGYCQGAGCPDGERPDPERQEVLLWNRDVVAAGQPAHRPSERRAQPDLARGAPLGAEPGPAEELAAELLVPLAPLGPLGLLGLLA